MRTKQTRKNRTPRARKSLKGVWGHKGAPPKDVRWPKGAFTYERLFALNVDPTGKDPKKSCELTCRTKVAEGLINLPNGTTNATGTIYQLVSKKQPHGKVGRPIDIFVLKENYDPATMPLKPAKGTAKPVKVTVTPPTPATPAVVQPVPVVNTTPANPAPMVVVEFTKGGIKVRPIGPKVG
jgi:hypothetical protein